jgi:hypothetical protein
MLANHTEFRIEQFKKFYSFLMETAPMEFKPWFFPCKPNGKDPDAQAIMNLSRETKGSWKHPLAWLDKDEVVEHIIKGYNIAISGKMEDCLIVGDIDNKELIDQLPEYTLTTTSRKRIGGHFFGWDKDGSAKINLATDDGEMRSQDQYVIAPGSYVPFNMESEKDQEAFKELPEEIKTDPLLGYYTVRDEFHLRELSFNDLPSFFQKAFETETAEQQKMELVSNKSKKKFIGKGKYSELLNLKVSDIIGKYPSTQRFGHPLHESDTDANFSISPDGSVGQCWRHMVSLNAVQFLCVKAGYSKCQDAGTPHALKDKNGNKKRRGYSKLKGSKEALAVAYKEALKQGLISEYIPDKKELVPRGWGRVLDIANVAQEQQITVCPSCGNKLEFDSKMGWFSCKPCNIYGGIKKLLKMKYLQAVQQ